MMLQSEDIFPLKQESLNGCKEKNNISAPYTTIANTSQVNMKIRSKSHIQHLQNSLAETSELASKSQPIGEQMNLFIMASLQYCMLYPIITRAPFHRGQRRNNGALPWSVLVLNRQLKIARQHQFHPKKERKNWQVIIPNHQAVILFKGRPCTFRQSILPINVGTSSPLHSHLKKKQRIRKENKEKEENK